MGLEHGHESDIRYPICHKTSDSILNIIISYYKCRGLSFDHYSLYLFVSPFIKLTLHVDGDTPYLLLKAVENTLVLL